MKIRGHRVETRAIETVLARHDAVRACAVVPVADDLGHKRLVAYVLPAPDPAEFWPSVGDYGVYDELLYYALTTTSLGTTPTGAPSLVRSRARWCSTSERAATPSSPDSV